MPDGDTPPDPAQAPKDDATKAAAGPDGGGGGDPPPDPISARQRQIALHDETNKWLAYSVTGGFFLMIALLFIPGLGKVDDGVRNLLFTLLGVVGTGWATIISYYFGSSMGSNQKSQTLDALLAKRPPSSG